MKTKASSLWVNRFGIGIFLTLVPLSGIAASGETPSSQANSHGGSLGGPEAVATSRYQPKVGTKGMVVSDDPLASEWGAEILRQGGNAIDAAVATAFALAVTRPHYASIGGGGFMVYCPKPKDNQPSQCQTLDYREKAPQKAKSDLYVENGVANTKLSQDGPLASGTPGVTAGLLYALKNWGTFKRDQVLKKPIELAKNGFRFSPHAEKAAAERWNAMNAEARAIFGCAKEGSSKTPCPPGTVIRQPDLAKVLELISEDGETGFYQGEVAKKIVHGIQSGGGILTLEDLAKYSPQVRSPLIGKFKDYEIVTMPPPSSGGAILLQLLGYSERAEKAGQFREGFASTSSINAISFAMGHAFADRAQYFGDPDFVKVPLTSLLSPSYLDQQWKNYSAKKAKLPKKAGNIDGNEPQHTTHFSVIDRNGNAVAITTTVNDNFGSGFVPPGTGIVMNDEMDDFSTQPGVPNMFGLVGNEANAVAPFKRPLSSMTPTIVRDQKGNAQIVIGAAGGPRIITSVFLSLLNRLEFQMSIVDAVAAPRFHQQWKPVSTLYEKNGFPNEILNRLQKMGYSFKEGRSLGKVHALERFPDGRTWGAADPRGEGGSAVE